MFRFRAPAALNESSTRLRVHFEHVREQPEATIRRVDTAIREDETVRTAIDTAFGRGWTVIGRGRTVIGRRADLQVCRYSRFRAPAPLDGPSARLCTHAEHVRERVQPRFRGADTAIREDNTARAAIDTVIQAAGTAVLRLDAIRAG